MLKKCRGIPHPVLDNKSPFPSPSQGVDRIRPSTWIGSISLRVLTLVVVITLSLLPNITASAVTSTSTSPSDGFHHAMVLAESTHDNVTHCIPVEEPSLGPGDPNFYTYIFLTLACVIIGGIMSGLQVGLFSLDPLKLNMLLQDETADPADKKRARRLIPVLERHHRLLVSLLVCNAAAMEAMPIFLDQLVPSYVAVILSVTFVLFFGEVIPQALCVKSPLAIGAFLIPFVRFLMVLVLPVAWPVAKLLDWVLGVEGGNHFLLQRPQLNALVDLHAQEMGGTLHEDTVSIMKGAMAFTEKRVSDIMTPIQDVYMLEVHRNLDLDVMTEIFKSGYSRIPCYDQERKQDGIIGLLIVKDMILLDPQDAIPISTILNLYGRPVTKVFSDVSLQELLQTFRTGRSHMAIVQEVNSDGPGDPFYVNIGIVTLEDVIECIMNAKIEDETDIDDSHASKGRGRFNLVTRYARRKLPSNLAPQEFSAVFFHLTGVVDVFKTGHRTLSEQGLKKLIHDSSVIETRINTPQHIDLAHEASLAAMGQSPDGIEFNDIDITSGGRNVYQRGVANDYFVLILDGCVEIRAGVDEFLSEGRRWSVLGTMCLKLAEQRLSTQLTHIERYYANQGITNINIPAILHDKHMTLAQLLQQTGYNVSQEQQYIYIPDFTAIVKQTTRILRISRHIYIREIMREMGLWTGMDEERDQTLRQQSMNGIHIDTYDHLTSMHSMPLHLHNSKAENVQKRENKIQDEEQEIEMSNVHTIEREPEEKHRLIPSLTESNTLTLTRNQSVAPSSARPVYESPLLTRRSSISKGTTSTAPSDVQIDIHDTALGTMALPRLSESSHPALGAPGVRILTPPQLLTHQRSRQSPHDDPGVHRTSPTHDSDDIDQHPPDSNRLSLSMPDFHSSEHR